MGGARERPISLGGKNGERCNTTRKDGLSKRVSPIPSFKRRFLGGEIYFLLRFFEAENAGKYYQSSLPLLQAIKFVPPPLLGEGGGGNSLSLSLSSASHISLVIMTKRKSPHTTQYSREEVKKWEVKSRGGDKKFLPVKLKKLKVRK